MAQEHPGWHKEEGTGQYVHEVSVLVDAPPAECFQYWSNFENFPHIMRYITKVTRSSDTMWHWAANVANQHVEWDAGMTEYRPNELIGWQSTGGLRNSGTVRFEPVGGGCRITVRLYYDPPYGFIGDLVAMRGANDKFHTQLEEDLLNFKHSVESGETQRFRRAA